MAPSERVSSKTLGPRKSILKNSSQPRKLKADSLFATTKKDKRRIKHAQLLSKVQSSSKKPRRRRANKKLVATLDSLADALPDFDEDGSGGGASGIQPQGQINVIKRKSIKSRPGAMKRREKIDRGERDRFAQNMAQMATNTTTVGSAGAVPKPEDRWTALRSFITQTMETKT